MGEKNNFTVYMGDSAMSDLSEVPEITPDTVINTEEDLENVRVSGTESATFNCRLNKKFSNKTRWELCKSHLRLAFMYLRLIVKSVFSEED